MSISFVDTIVPEIAKLDVIPEVSDIEYPCVICGKEAGPYSGRGRHPKKCTEHRTTQVNKGTRVTGTNATLASQATEALCQINGFLTIGAMFAGMPATAGAITAAEDGFREQTYNALLTDPDLCRSILKAGVKSGKIALLISYLMLGAAVMPIAVLEFKAKQQERAERKAANEAEE
jgi:hypothetical protein